MKAASVYSTLGTKVSYGNLVALYMHKYLHRYPTGVFDSCGQAIYPTVESTSLGT